MRIFKSDEIKLEKSKATLFTEEVTRASLLSENDAGDFVMSIVNFPKGVRNKFHTHSSDQVLIMTAGRGIVATEDEEKLVASGDIALIPAHIKHWHGATADSDFAHISMIVNGAETVQLES